MYSKTTGDIFSVKSKREQSNERDRNILPLMKSERERTLFPLMRSGCKQNSCPLIRVGVSETRSFVKK